MCAYCLKPMNGRRIYFNCAGDGYRGSAKKKSSKITTASNPLRLREQQRRIDLLLTFRIVQENLLYVIGMPQQLANEALLSSDRFFGSFGTVRKLLINKQTGSKDSAYEGQCGVYVWYEHPVQVALALKVINLHHKPSRS